MRTALAGEPPARSTTRRAARTTARTEKRSTGPAARCFPTGWGLRFILSRSRPRDRAALAGARRGRGFPWDEKRVRPRARQACTLKNSLTAFVLGERRRRVWGFGDAP